MGYIRTEEEVDRMIDEMLKKSKGRYITQGVSFSKENERHLELLKMVLLRSHSFSGFIKELLAKMNDMPDTPYYYPNTSPPHQQQVQMQVQEPIPQIDTGNFL